MLAVASLPGLAGVGAPEHVLRGVLLCGAVALVRELAGGAALSGTLCVALLLGTWAAALGGFTAMPAAAQVAHLVLPGLGAAVLCQLVLRRLAAAAPLVLPPLVGHVLAVSFGLACAGVWEVYEWCMSNSVLRGTIGVDYDDTIADLVLGAVGGLVAGAWCTNQLVALRAAILRPGWRPGSGRPSVGRRDSASRR